MREMLTDRGKELIIVSAFMVAASDGDIADEELAYLASLGAALDLSPHHVTAVINELVEG